MNYKTIEDLLVEQLDWVLKYGNNLVELGGSLDKELINENIAICNQLTYLAIEL